jgi:hypothetical protein
MRLEARGYVIMPATKGQRGPISLSLFDSLCVQPKVDRVSCSEPSSLDVSRDVHAQVASPESTESSASQDALCALTPVRTYFPPTPSPFAVYAEPLPGLSGDFQSNRCSEVAGDIQGPHAEGCNGFPAKTLISLFDTINLERKCDVDHSLESDENAPTLSSSVQPESLHVQFPEVESPDVCTQGSAACEEPFLATPVHIPFPPTPSPIGACNQSHLNFLESAAWCEQKAGFRLSRPFDQPDAEHGGDASVVEGAERRSISLFHSICTERQTAVVNRSADSGSVCSKLGGSIQPSYADMTAAGSSPNADGFQSPSSVIPMRMLFPSTPSPESRWLLGRIQPQQQAEDGVQRSLSNEFDSIGDISGCIAEKLEVLGGTTLPLPPAPSETCTRQLPTRLGRTQLQLQQVALGTVKEHCPAPPPPDAQELPSVVGEMLQHVSARTIERRDDSIAEEDWEVGWLNPYALDTSGLSLHKTFLHVPTPMQKDSPFS